jgi:hypothetical protein
MILPVYQADLARILNVTRGAVADRIRRGTLPPYDGTDGRGRGYWLPKTLEEVVKKSNDDTK